MLREVLANSRFICDKVSVLRDIRIHPKKKKRGILYKVILRGASIDDLRQMLIDIKLSVVIGLT